MSVRSAASFGLAGLLAVAAAAHAAEGESVKYVPPDGFAGHYWGEVRAAFHRLPTDPVGVGAAYMFIQEKQTAYSCQLTTWLPARIETWIPQCRYDDTLRHPNKDLKLGGIYVVSEYAIDDQGFRYGDEKDGVVLAPVIYQFCANWQGRRGKPPPPNFDDLNRFCGMKFIFKTETLSELAHLPSEHVSNYDRVLERLIAKYGQPQGFKRHGKVFIDTMSDQSIDEAARSFRTWRWCPPGDVNGMSTACAASITLTVDPFSGNGAILYSTPIVWEFAFAREKYGFKGDALYRILHDRG